MVDAHRAAKRLVRIKVNGRWREDAVSDNALLADYLQEQVKAGVLAVEDCEIAAAQFIDACQATLFKPMIFNFGAPPTEERIRHVVGIAVKTFIAAYLVR